MNTLRQLEDLFFNTTCKALGLNPQDKLSENSVRFPWRNDPEWEHEDDVCFIAITNEDDRYNRQFEVKHTPISKEVADYTIENIRAIQIAWTLYGPNSFDRAHTLRNYIYMPDTQLLLKQSSMYMVTDIAAPIRFPEQFRDLWWDRSNLMANFYEKTQSTSTVPLIQGVDIKLYTEKGEVKSNI